MPVDRYGRRRGVPSDIGFDRAGPGARAELVSPPPSRDRFGPRGPHARDARVGPPADIGYDRAGGYGTANDMRQILNRAGSSEDKFRDYINNVGRPRSYPPASIGDDPVWRGAYHREGGVKDQIRSQMPWDQPEYRRADRNFGFRQYHPDFMEEQLRAGQYGPGRPQSYPGMQNPRVKSRMEMLMDEQQGVDPTMDSGEYLASKFGGGIDDAAGMNDSARGMIEDAGFEVAGGPLMVEKRMLKKFWGTAVNKFPPGTANEILIRERDRLFNIWKKKAYTPGTGGGLLRFLKKIGPKGGGPLGIGMDLMPVEPALESIDQLYNPDPIVI